MDGRGGCCIARYVGGAYDMSKVDRIMLKFRPIAPKPVSSGSVSLGSPPSDGELTTKMGRGKRKYVRDPTTSNSKRCNRRRKTSSPETKNKGSDAETVVTLPLLPEIPERKESPTILSPVLKTTEITNPKQSMWLNFNNGSLSVNDEMGYGSTDRTVVMAPLSVRTVASCVTVECVTDTWSDGSGLGYTDEERMRNLGADTCPGFISDGMGKVTWTNETYRKMVGQGGKCSDLRVWLGMKDSTQLMRLGTLLYPAFTCRVRLQYTRGKEKNSLTLPCDVWRMDGGGYAWRLDVKAALSLGR